MVKNRNIQIKRIVLADDDERVLQYVRTLLADEGTVDLVGEAADGEGLLRLVEELDPDVMLVDVVMPGLNGIATARRALASSPELKVIVFSLHDDRQMVDAALEVGASGYLLKDHLDQELSDALAAVLRGETFLSAALGMT